MWRLYAYGAAAATVLVIAYGVWIGGIHHERSRSEAATATARIETILNTKGARDAAKNLDDDSLLNALGRWLLHE
jgi:hypothetical protein